MARAQGLVGTAGPAVRVAPWRLVARAIQALFGIYNVKHYGAKGNGTTDDTAAIQAAIDAAEAFAIGSARGGAEVYFPVGIYKTSAALKARIGNVKLRGANKGYPTGGLGANPVTGGTIIRPGSVFADGFAIQVKQDVASPDHALGGVTLCDFAIDCVNVSGTVGGIWFQAQRSQIRDVLITRATGTGIKVEAPDGVNSFPKNAYDNYFRDVIITQAAANPVNAGHGIHFTAGATDNVVEGLIVRGEAAGFYGIYAQGVGNQFHGGLVELCNDYGAYCAESRNVKFIGVRFLDCAGGIYLTSSDVTQGGDWNITGCTFRSCSRLGDNLTDGIQVNPSVTMRGGVIDGCDFSSVGRNDPGYAMRYLINVATANAVGVVIGSYTQGYVTPATQSYGTAPINDLGTGTRIGESTIARGAVAQSHTGDAIETTLASITIPGRALGPNGRVRVTSLWSRNAAGVGNATARVRFGGAAGTSYLNAALTTTNLSAQFQSDIANRNSTNSQIGPSTSASFGLVAGAAVTSAIDTATDVVIAFTGTLANAADTVTLESYTVEILH